jgi:hypothetical protein
VSTRFENLHLHDAYLTSILFDWEKDICSFTMSAFLDGIGKDGMDCILQFDRVSRVEIPHEAPWGKSSYVHTIREPAEGTFIIEMQSGDEIRIAAESFTITKTEPAA